MKRIKMLLIIIAMVILLLMTANNVMSYPNDPSMKYDQEQIRKNGGIQLGAAIVKKYNNIYCVQKGEDMGDGLWYFPSQIKAVISGEDVTFYTTSRLGSVDFVNEIPGKKGSFNNLMAAILCEKGDNGEFTLGKWTSNNEDTTSQLALWNQWNSWLVNSGCTTLLGNAYLPVYYMNGITPEGDDISNLIKAYSNYSAKNKYNATIYFVIHEEVTSYQSLIIVERGEKETREIEIPVTKKWNDNNNAYGNRPTSITVKLYKNDVDTGKTLILNEGNGWSGKFTNLQEGTGYSVKESSEPNGYTVSYSGNQSSGFIITNTLKYTSVTVKKVWDDNNNRDGKRPSSIKVTLYENGVATNTTAILNSSNGWTYTFNNLPQYKNKNQVKYTVKEDVPNGYTSIESSSANQFTITNKYVPEVTQVKVIKKWDDMDNLDDLRTPITVTLYKNGTATNQTATLSESNNWTYTFTNLYKYESGKEIKYTVEENVSEGYISTKTNNSNEIIITNTYKPNYAGYIEISGKVWVDKPDGKGNNINGTFDSHETGLGGIKVTLKDGNGNIFDKTSTTTTADDGTYTIKVNYDNRQNVYKLYENSETVKTKLQTAYVEFEYDVMKYTTVATATTGENTSKAIENETMRNSFDSSHSRVISSTTAPENWTDKTITAITKDVISFKEYNDKTSRKSSEIIKYCNGNGAYKHTNPNGAWNNIIIKNHTCENCTKTGHVMRTYDIDVEVIQNVNLGLFEREQPDVAIFSDLTKVEVEMNGQKYTYLYGIRGAESNNVGLKAKFQNKGTYTYRRPVNPADIAYIQEEAHKDAMSVKVTYEVKLANLSTTLPITVHNITNYFDPRYTLNTSGWTVTGGTEFNKATYNGDLNITVKPQTESSAIELTYTVSMETIRKLLNEEATLNNAVEIESFSTQYGELTLYAEQRTGGRTGQPYAGYDYNSQPGNAGIFINGDGRLEAAKPEDDTDIAPSFVLCLDNSKTLTGTVWEDGNEKDNSERIGNGHRDDSENKVKNIKVELYEVDNSGTITSLATLYKVDSTGNISTPSTSKYTDENGNYTFEGLVTGKEYIVKYTYGNDSSELEGNITTISGNEVNARNYKSTIITDEDPNVKNILEKDYSSFTDKEKMWPITHKDKYSVAVDNMEDRLNIGVLKNSTYNVGENMIAYTKPFIIPLEFDSTLITSGESDKDGNTKNSTGELIKKVLDKFDFGIIERPREELIVQKTISYFKITLANGQVLTEGNPNDPNANMSYAKAIGFKDITTVEEARKALEKRLLVEIDSELIQGAQLELTYSVRVINNNEIDYDYGELTDYTNGYIAKGDKASYYYYGVRKGQDEMQSTIRFVDYLDSDLVHKEDVSKWIDPDKDTLEKLKDNGYIDKDTVYFELKNGGYTILQTPIDTATGESTITLRRGIEYSFSQEMTTSKLLTIRDDNTFYNHAEIIEIDGKTGRTVKGKYEDGTQITYIPGNYTPSAGLNEPDDDNVNITITPPTGITNYVTTYIIAGLAGMIIMIIGIVFIKKRVLS